MKDTNTEMMMAQTNRGEEHPVARELGRAGMQPGMTANELLDDDHNRVLQLFNRYENRRAEASAQEKHEMARAICRELKIHTQIEEEIWYPQLRSRGAVEDRVDAAVDDHARAKELIRKVESASTQDEAIDDAMRALADDVRQHIHEERDGLFEVAELSDCNTPEMARALLSRKKELEKSLH